MKIILTGSTSPIGKVLYQHLTLDNEVKTITRNDGWDLNDCARQEELISLTADYDAFINCAHIGYLQGSLLTNSKAKINISFGSLATKMPWLLMQKITTPVYISEKLFLDYAHQHKKNSALIKISNYGEGPVPSVKDEQILYAVDDVLSGRAILPIVYEISNGLGDQYQASF